MAAFSLEGSTWVTALQRTLPQKSAVSCSWELPGQTALAQHLQWVLPTCSGTDHPTGEKSVFTVCFNMFATSVHNPWDLPGDGVEA